LNSNNQEQKMRQLKHFEKKLIKKVDLFAWKSDNNLREGAIVKRYYLKSIEEYKNYSKIVGNVTKFVAKLKELDSTDELRDELSRLLLEKLYNMGVINETKSLLGLETLSVTSFCKRRLPVVMVRLKMAETMKEAVTFVEQGHIRVGPNVVTDPSYLVTRMFEDYVTWVDGSKIKRAIKKYNDQLDDFDLLQN
jgi:U3 small nucleolar ribonucleoprotein protein IMP3